MAQVDPALALFFGSSFGIFQSHGRLTHSGRQGSLAESRWPSLHAGAHFKRLRKTAAAVGRALAPQSACPGLLGSSSMKAYVVTTGTVFGLLTLAHLLRIIAEGMQLAKEPWFVLITVASAVLSFWAWRLLRTRTQ